MSEENDNTKELVKQEVKKIFANPTVQKAVLNMVDNRRPSGWSSRSYPTYYKEVYARQVQTEIDTMIDNYENHGDRSSIVFDFDTWCGQKDPRTKEREKMSERTLYIRINHSIRFLVDHLDTPDHRYAKWNQVTDVNISKSQGGIVISWNKEFVESVEGVAPKVRHVQPEQERPRWERQIEHYLADEHDFAPLIIDRLFLSGDEVLQLKKRFATLSNVMADINGSCIKLLKMREQ